MSSFPSGKKILYFDCFSGISGDMACGALADLTGDLELPGRTGALLNLEGVEVKVVRRISCGIVGKGLEVQWGKKGVVERTLEDIRNLIEGSSLPPWVITKGIEAFELLAEAEGRVHGVQPEEVHFHEVGAIDSIVDVVTFFHYLYGLEGSCLFSSHLPSGNGVGDSSHGTIPLPAPATLEIVKGRGIPFSQSPVEGESVTPTGALLLVSAEASFSPPPPMTIERTGYGVGSRKSVERPNVLRIIEGEVMASPAGDRVVLISSNVDDMNPQHVELLMERVFEMGALDFFVTPVQMKKNRPGWLFTAITRRKNSDAVVGAFFSLSPTTGVRIREEERVKLKRRVSSLTTVYGAMNVKVIEFPEGYLRAVPEYDDIKRILKEKRVPLNDLLEEVRRVWEKER